MRKWEENGQSAGPKAARREPFPASNLTARDYLLPRALHPGPVFSLSSLNLAALQEFAPGADYHFFHGDLDAGPFHALFDNHRQR